jgi:uncharacterized damage-inducible protein DinB
VSGALRRRIATVTYADILRHFAYNKWANDRTLQAISALNDEQVTRNLGSSFPSIRDTAAHIASAEWVWLRRWKGEGPSAHPDWSKQGPMYVIVAKFAEIEEERSEWLGTLTSADLDLQVTFRLFNGTEDTQPLGPQFMHVVNHSTYHRGQIAGMIRQVGGTPIATDLIAYQRTINKT